MKELLNGILTIIIFIIIILPIWCLDAIRFLGDGDFEWTDKVLTWFLKIKRDGK